MSGYYGIGDLGQYNIGTVIASRNATGTLMKAFFSILAAIAMAAINLIFTGGAWAQIPGVAAVHGNVSRTLLGPGTGVVIGIVDSGVNSAHPAISGVDSQGNPRLVAEANFVTSEPSNT